MLPIQEAIRGKENQGGFIFTLSSTRSVLLRLQLPQYANDVGELGAVR